MKHLHKVGILVSPPLRKKQQQHASMLWQPSSVNKSSLTCRKKNEHANNWKHLHTLKFAYKDPWYLLHKTTKMLG